MRPGERLDEWADDGHHVTPSSVRFEGGTDVERRFVRHGQQQVCEGPDRERQNDPVVHSAGGSPQQGGLLEGGR
nr:hypothetical protein [Nonomuraea ceibae]